MISNIVSGIIEFYAFVIVIYVLMSWFRPSSGILYDVYTTLASVCEPYIGLFRRIVPVASGIDFSPLVAILVLQMIIGPVLIRVLLQLGL